MKLKHVFTSIAIFLLLILTACSSTTGNQLPKSDEYDAVLASGDNYHIVMKRVDSFDSAYDMVGVVDSNGAWLHELSQSHPLIENGTILTGDAPVVHVVGGGDADTSTVESIRMNSIRKNITYLGEAMFVLNYASNGNGANLYMLYNAETNEGWDLDVCYGITQFHDGYMTCQADNKVYSSVKIISREGQIIQTGIETDGGNVGPYSEGVFFSGVNFYHIDGTLAIDLSDHIVVNTPYFENEKCYLEIENNAGSVYHTQIDHDGNFLYEPKKK